eukprot:CAMPEP_0115885064 /NCGR_PEP_ID=MMETSP0287-20121206/30462_1 /TAXON_ID=412157 /ORGANISM="Chrysochromulina rotalis, Strain UIO044" /LENGTH=86 /DNA_ID=CAMNT_0003341431 /DNA_START=198 /DNA_END=455 /DNA_ORIENTATION=+
MSISAQRRNIIIGARSDYPWPISQVQGIVLHILSSTVALTAARLRLQALLGQLVLAYAHHACVVRAQGCARVAVQSDLDHLADGLP